MTPDENEARTYRWNGVPYEQMSHADLLAALIEATDIAADVNAFMSDLKRRADEAEAELARVKEASQWNPIETIANLNPESLVLAACHPDDEFPDGRVMIWKVRILLDNIRRGNSTPEHLRYPASHWMPLPTPPERA